MYEETRRFSWTNLFIKIIIAVIFILFTIWLLSFTTKNATRGMSNSLGVLTDNIFASNVEKMKEVGKSYFTTERLPEKIGDIKTLSLAKMYDENLILELKDKNGNACSAKNSYVTVEKMETEYQMKVYLECGSEKDFIKVIMGCYNYCNTDICEKKEEEPVVNNNNIEYEYSKTVGGSWGPYGAWTNWSTTVVTKNSYRDVETKTVKENYTYDKTVTNTVYVKDATCPSIDGYTLVGDNNGICSYTKVITSITNPTTCAKNYNGYSLISQNGFTCNYSKNTTTTVNPVSCASTYNGYNLTSQNGFTCNYSKTTTSTIAATASTSGGSPIYGQSCYNKVVGTKTVWDCSKTCRQSIQNVTEYVCESVITGYTSTTTTYSCPSGYTRSGSSCTTSSTAYTTTTVGCPSGYTKSGNSCVATGTATTTTTVGCPLGYTKSGNSCVVSSTATTTTTVGCPSGYAKRGNTCAKDDTYTKEEKATCPSGTKMQNGKCYKDETKVEKVTGTKDVTYYRYRLREYVGGTKDYKWSTSNNDKSLINAGYKLTGKTRNIGGK